MFERFMFELCTYNRAYVGARSAYTSMLLESTVSRLELKRGRQLEVFELCSCMLACVGRRGVCRSMLLESTVSKLELKRNWGLELLIPMDVRRVRNRPWSTDYQIVIDVSNRRLHRLVV